MTDFAKPDVVVDFCILDSVLLRLGRGAIISNCALIFVTVQPICYVSVPAPVILLKMTSIISQGSISLKPAHCTHRR